MTCREKDFYVKSVDIIQSRTSIDIVNIEKLYNPRQRRQKLDVQIWMVSVPIVFK